MTIRSRFHILVLLVVLLTFSSHTVFGRGPRPTKRKVERKQNPAETQAKRDAEADVNKLLWTGVGFAAPFGTMLTMIAGGAIGHAFSPEVSGSGLITLSKGAVCGGYVGGCVGMTFGTLVPIRAVNITPPPERLLGKSPQYIDVYTDVYKTRTRQLRGRYTAAGYGLFTMIGMIVALIGE